MDAVAPTSHAARRRRRALAARNDSAFSSDDCVVPSKFTPAATTTVNEIETPSTTFSETTYAETPMPASSPASSVEYLSTSPESSYSESPVPPAPADLESPPAAGGLRATPPTVHADSTSFLAASPPTADMPRSDMDGFPLRRVGFSSDSTCTETPKARFVPEAGGVCPPSDRPPSPIQIAREKIDDALDNLYVATGVKRAHVAAAVVAMPCFVASWRSAALMCVGTLYPILLAANACSDDKAAAARKNLLLYFVLASLHQLAPVCWWVPFNVQFAATLFLVHFEGAAALFDFFLKAYFEPAEVCTTLVKTARKVRRRVSCRFSLTPPRRSS